MATVDVPLERIRFGQNKRRDLWWAMPLTTFIVFSSFIVYVTWALLQGEHYLGNYLAAVLPDCSALSTRSLALEVTLGPHQLLAGDAHPDLPLHSG
jgi:hypothetical protein